MKTNLNVLFDKAKQVLSHAYAPYSKFKVACCILTKKGQFYAGCNVENASYGLTSCAEATAIGQMISAGESEIAEVFILIDRPEPCSPCGACRQRLIEFANVNTPVHLATVSGGMQQTFSLRELLPHSFTARNFKEV